MAENKTKENDGDVLAFIESVENEKRRADAKVILELMSETIGEEPVMWGASLVGFGKYQYKYKSGREGEWFLSGFSPRKANMTLYIMAGFDAYDGLLSQLGKYKLGKSCLYIKKVEDVDLDVLRELVKQSAEHVSATNSVMSS